MSELTDRLRPFVDAIERSAAHGNKKALTVIQLYQMHSRRPDDQCAIGLCSAAFDDWRKDTSIATSTRR
jgi:hypothetical protein